jgi:glycosyltransferase involved in cell wall biosynthesis
LNNPSNRKIVIYTTGDFPLGGAPENLVRQFALGLHKANNNVRVIRLRGSHYNYSNDTPVKRVNFLFNKIPSNEFVKFIELFLSIIYTPLSVFIEKVRYKREIIFLYGVEYSYKTFPFLIACRLLNLKIYRIITDHYEDKMIAPVFWKRLKLFFYIRQFKIFDKKFNGIIVLSHYLKEIALKNGVKEKNILLTPHYIDLSSLQIHDNTETINEQITTIGFCGNTMLENGIIDLLMSFSILAKNKNDIQLLIIGKNNQWIEEYINTNVPENLQSKITITGFLSKKEVEKQLAKCTILVNPRKSSQFAQAGFPTKLGEYFATKKPVVSTATGDIAKYFANTNNLIVVEPNNPDSIANGIQFLIDNRPQAEQIGINGYNWAFENLDYEKNTLKVINFINREEQLT